MVGLTLMHADYTLCNFLQQSVSVYLSKWCVCFCVCSGCVNAEFCILSCREREPKRRKVNVLCSINADILRYFFKHYYGYDLNVNSKIISPVSLNCLHCLTFVLFIDHNIYIAVDSIARFKERTLHLYEVEN